MPKFSIIMPVYNNEKYFPIAAESILSQSFKDFEFIIIDDGSTDGTPEIIDALARTDGRIRVVHQENQWIYASFNNGINIAEGEYIYIVNSDDRLRDGSLMRMAEKVDTYNPDIIWTKVLVHKCDDKQNMIDYDYLCQDRTVEKELFLNSADEVRDHWLFFCSSNLAQNQANLYRRDIMKRHRFRNDVYGADTLYNIEIAPDIKSALVLKEAVYDHFIYASDKMNASYGKYYGYEHEMFNDIYLGYINLFKGWNRLDDETKRFFGKGRLRNLTYEIRSFHYSNCRLNTEQKIQILFSTIVDEVVFQCAKELECVDELEARVLSGLREILLREKLYPESAVYFVYEMLDSLLRYEKDEIDFQKIEQAIEHPLNVYHIGQFFYKIITGEGKNA